MQFENFKDLVDQINSSLGSFCNTFQYTRKDLVKTIRIGDRGRIFGNIKEEDGWAINKGGGTELQYHIAFNKTRAEVKYGLGFNTQYVPHANKLTPVEYMKPFMKSFINKKEDIKRILPDYDFVIGDLQMIVHPQYNEYVLFGKKVDVTKINNSWEIIDSDYEKILADLKNQLNAYKIIFVEKYKMEKMGFKNIKIKNLLEYKKQIIFQGPPGTGKTFTAKDIAEEMIYHEISEDKEKQKELLENSDQFKLIQFHPAYSYEDFVRGITAKSKDGIIEYATENNVLAKFAKKALKNFNDSNKEQLEVSKEKWVNEQFEKFIDFIADEIENKGKIEVTGAVNIIKIEEDAFRYKGVDGWSKSGNRMLFEDIKQAYLDDNMVRQNVKHNQNLSGLAKWHASYYVRVLDLFKKFLKDNDLVFKQNIAEKVELKKYILIIDEINRANLPAVLGELIYALEYRGEGVESMYKIDGDNLLIIPPNLYIIGTMNTADRSVGHIDYAIRRRFAFVDILPDASIIQNASARSLFDEISQLFQSKDTLASDFKATQVQLGHSYFIVKDDSELQLKAKYEIVPILEEYLKDGILLEKAEKTILDLKQRFDN